MTVALFGATGRSGRLVLAEAQRRGWPVRALVREASRLPADGWLELARQQMAAGEWRLALRALFLATLARHAYEGLLSLAKFKTNLDYEAELRRRAHSRTVLVEEFRGRRRQFEEVWYGAAPASDALVRDWLQRMEGRA